MRDLKARQVPRLVSQLVVFELRLYWSLLRWLARRPDHGGMDAAPTSYARTVTPVLWLWIFASAMEVPLIHVLVPWDSIRLPLLVVGVWGLLWMVGLLASLWVYPHLSEPTHLRVRYGASTDLAVPWSRITAVTTERRDLDSPVRTLQPLETERGAVLRVGVSGQVNVHLTFDGPVTLETHSFTEGRRSAEYVGLSLFADDPREMVDLVRRKLPVSRPGRP